jgi:hypothetical protein
VDNQYHLQALRHLYVLAVEQRALQVVDVDTGGVVAVDVWVELMDGRRVLRRAPCLLPELGTVHAVHLSEVEEGQAYYPTRMVVTGRGEGGESGSGDGSGGIYNGSSSSGGSSGSGSEQSSSAPHVLFVKRRPLGCVGVGVGHTSTLLGAALLTRLTGSKAQQQQVRGTGEENATGSQLHLDVLMGMMGSADLTRTVPAVADAGADADTGADASAMTGVDGGVNTGANAGADVVAGAGVDADGSVVGVRICSQADIARALVCGGTAMARDICLQAIKDAVVY